jgi:hypothetical protein
VWNLLVHPQRNIIFIETRHETLKQVQFSALDLSSNNFLWRDIVLEEPWWITMTDVSANTLLFTVFNDTNNPDKKSILAFDFEKQAVLWWRNNYAVSAVTPSDVIGVDTTFGRKNVVLDLLTGQPGKDQTVLPAARNFSIQKPLQYYEDAGHFNTVKSFLESKLRIQPLSLIEYLEYRSLIVISCYLNENGLANFLFVLTQGGELLFTEKLGEGLKGIGVDTFFIFSGYLIFVKNKSWLASYKVV